MKKILAEDHHRIRSFLPDCKHLVDSNNCDELWKQFSTSGYILLKGLQNSYQNSKETGNMVALFAGLIDINDIERAYRHTEKFLCANSLMDATSKEISLDRTKTKKVYKEGFVAALDGETLIKGSKKSSSGGETSLATCATHRSIHNLRHNAAVLNVLKLLCLGRNRQMMNESQGAGSMASVHMLSDQYAWLRCRGFREYTPRHCDITHFRLQTDLFRSSSDENSSQNDVCCVCLEGVGHITLTYFPISFQKEYLL